MAGVEIQNSAYVIGISVNKWNKSIKNGKLPLTRMEVCGIMYGKRESRNGQRDSF